MRTLSGDVGLVTPGAGKKIVWNAWTDWGRNYTTNARVRLIADDFPSTIGMGIGGNATTNVPPAANLVWIPHGVFAMTGDLFVYISNDFWMGKYEVTQAEYQNVMSNNPSAFTGNPNRPVEQVTWNDAVSYCQTLTAREQAEGRLGTNWAYRLPTEAEWEYACRAGTTTTYCFGEDPNGNRLGYYAWYGVNSGSQTHEVGSRAPNRWGLYDMTGNVYEFCSDWFGWLYGGTVTDPQGPQGPSYVGWGNWTGRLVRGGSWSDSDRGFLTSAYRTYFDPSSCANYVGFRVVLAPCQ